SSAPLCPYTTLFRSSDGAVAVDVALGLGLQDQLALVGAGLAGVGADVAALVGIAVQNGLVGLTVDEDDGDGGGRDGVHDGLGRRSEEHTSELQSRFE